MVIGTEMEEYCGENRWVWNWENDEYEIELWKTVKLYAQEPYGGCKVWCTHRLCGGRVLLMHKTEKLNGVQVLCIHKKAAGVRKQKTRWVKEPYSTRLRSHN